MKLFRLETEAGRAYFVEASTEQDAIEGFVENHPRASNVSDVLEIPRFKKGECVAHVDITFKRTALVRSNQIQVETKSGDLVEIERTFKNIDQALDFLKDLGFKRI